MGTSADLQLELVEKLYSIIFQGKMRWRKQGDEFICIAGLKRFQIEKRPGEDRAHFVIWLFDGANLSDAIFSNLITGKIRHGNETIDASEAIKNIYFKIDSDLASESVSSFIDILDNM
jgi:hypothetical protein